MSWAIDEDEDIIFVYNDEAHLHEAVFNTNEEAEEALILRRKMMARAKVHALHMNPIQKFILQIKLKVPKSANLTTKESDVVIDGWKKQSQANLNTTSAMVTVSKKTETHLASVNRQVVEVLGTLEEAQKGFKGARSEAKKIVWARRVVLAGETHSQLIQSKKRMNDTIQQVKETIEDARLAKMMLDSRIEEAQIYRELNGGLKLVGESLSSARKEHVVAKVEKENFDTMMTVLDRNITSKSNETLLKEAKKYLAIGNVKTK